MNPASYDPETIATMKSVLDGAIKTLPTRYRTQTNNVAIASCLLEAAAEGHRSEEALLKIAACEVEKYRRGCLARGR
ncbi:MAG: hypothetical protein JWR49_1091 [Tardiphaga sp.]|jgi:hypothetical protein|nr:hypothetical protein [Tardiphaga sp.]